MSEAEQIEKAFDEWERLTAAGDLDTDWEREAGIEYARVALAAQAARAEQYRLALEFYAAPEHWVETKLTPVTSPDGSIYLVAVPVLLEMGRKAQAAILAATVDVEPRAGQPPQTGV